MTHETVHVRLATANDVEHAWGIVNEYNKSIGVVKRDDPAHFSQYLSAPNAFWFAEKAGDTIGCVALRALPQVAPRACEVKRLYVRASYRGAGIAGTLMDTVEAYARDAGYDSMYLDTFEALAAAVRFYERRGYERIPRYNDNPQATIFMRKTLIEG
jgi:N-acetylglutamate synthase-like GNAT family acetyltransferase